MARMDFFFNDTATTEIYTLSLHDALPILVGDRFSDVELARAAGVRSAFVLTGYGRGELEHQSQLWPHHPDLVRSEEHTSELQSRQYLVCRLLLEKKKLLLLHLFFFLHYLP